MFYVDAHKQNTTQGKRKERIDTYTSRNCISGRKLDIARSSTSNKLSMLTLSHWAVRYKGPTVEPGLGFLCASAHHPPLHSSPFSSLRHSSKYARLGISTGYCQSRPCVPCFHPLLRPNLLTVRPCSRLLPDDVYIPGSVPMGTVHYM